MMGMYSYVRIATTWSRGDLMLLGLVLALAIWSAITTDLWQKCQRRIRDLLRRCRMWAIICLSSFIVIRRMIVSIEIPVIQLIVCSSTGCIDVIRGRLLIVIVGSILSAGITLWCMRKSWTSRDPIESNGAATRDPVMPIINPSTPYSEQSNIYLMTPESLTNVIIKALTPAGDCDHPMPLKTLIEEFTVFKTDVQQQFNNIENYLQTFYGNVPSANFVSFSFDDLCNRMEDRFKELESIVVTRLDMLDESLAKENGILNGYESDHKESITEIEPEAEALTRYKSHMIASNITTQANVIQESAHMGKAAYQSKAVCIINPVTELETTPAGVNAIGDTWKKVAGKTHKKDGRPSKPRTLPKVNNPHIPETQLNQYAAMSEDELFNHLIKIRKERREEAAKPKYLTEEEKTLTVAELDRRFRERERLEKEGRMERSKQDLGVLSMEERALPISELKNLIKRRRYDAWVKDMTEQGIPLHRCTVCGELATQRHRCMSTSWSTIGKSGALPIKKELIMTQSGGGDVRLRQIRQVDPDELEKRHAAIVAEKKKMEIENERLNRLLDAKIDPPSTTDDSLMEVVVDVEHPKVNILQNNRNFR